MTTTQQEEQSTPTTEQSTEGVEESSESLPQVVDVPKNDGQIYQVLDGLDDELIKAELENRITEVWVYSFKQDGKPITGLSKVGVDAACTEMAKSGHIIEESPVQYTIDPTDDGYVLFTVTASRVLVNLETGQRTVLETVNGTKRQAVKMFTKKKGMVADPFWFEKGAMKAVRNARSRLIPEEVKSTIIALAKEGGKVKHITKNDVAPVKYAKGKDKRFIEAWIKDNCSGDRELFKEWAYSMGTPMIGKDNGKYTLNKVDMRLVDRIKANPDNAAENFGTWLERKKEPVMSPEEVAAEMEGEVVNA